MGSLVADEMWLLPQTDIFFTFVGSLRKIFVTLQPVWSVPNRFK